MKKLLFGTIVFSLLFTVGCKPEITSITLVSEQKLAEVEHTFFDSLYMDEDNYLVYNDAFVGPLPETIFLWGCARNDKITFSHEYRDDNARITALNYNPHTKQIYMGLREDNDVEITYRLQCFNALGELLYDIPAPNSISDFFFSGKRAYVVFSPEYGYPGQTREISKPIENGSGEQFENMYWVLDDAGKISKQLYEKSFWFQCAYSGETPMIAGIITRPDKTRESGLWTINQEGKFEKIEIGVSNLIPSEILEVTEDTIIQKMYDESGTNAFLSKSTFGTNAKQYDVKRVLNRYVPYRENSVCKMQYVNGNVTVIGNYYDGPGYIAEITEEGECISFFTFQHEGQMNSAFYDGNGQYVLISYDNDSRGVFVARLNDPFGNIEM